MIEFIIGVVAGGILGVVVASCCAVASNTDRDMNDDNNIDKK